MPEEKKRDEVEFKSENRRGPDGRFLPGVAQGAGPGRPKNSFSFRHNLRLLISKPESEWPAVAMCKGQDLVMRRIRACERVVDEKDRAKVIDDLINQVEGAPRQTLDVEVNDITELSPEELRQRSRDLANELDELGGGGS